MLGSWRCFLHYKNKVSGSQAFDKITKPCLSNYRKAVLFAEHSVPKLGIKSENSPSFQQLPEKQDMHRMDSRALATGATILLFVMLGVVVLSFIGSTTNLAGINPIGVLAATFTAGIGILWLIKTSR